MTTPSAALITYLGDGLAANRPATPNLATGLFGLWWSTDTKVLSIYDLVNASWSTLGGGGYSPGTVPTIVQSCSENTGLQGATFGVAPTNGNLLVSMSFNPSVAGAGSGWTNLLQNGSGTDYGTIATKTAGAGESTTQNPLASAPGTGCKVIWEISGANATPTISASSEAEQASASFATSVIIGPLDQKLLFLGAIGLVSSSGNLVNSYGVVQDQIIKTGATRQIVGGHATIDKFPIAQIAATISAASSYKPLGLILTS